MKTTDEEKIMVAAEIKTIRELLGWSQTRLAEELCVSQVAVHKWESGTNNPSRPVRKLLSQLKGRISRAAQNSENSCD